MKLFVFEGTPEEFKSVRPLLNVDLSGTAIANPEQTATPEASTPSDVVGLTEEMAKVFLMRRPLPKTQKDVLRAIKNANGAGVTSSELAKQIGCDVEMVKGAMRAFGKRAAHTQGWPDGLSAFVRTWEGSENRYRLHAEMRSVLESGIVPL